MPATILAILRPIGATLLSMLTAALTGPVIKRLIYNYMKAEARRYVERAAKTESKQDDEYAQLALKTADDLGKAWGLEE